MMIINVDICDGLINLVIGIVIGFLFQYLDLFNFQFNNYRFKYVLVYFDEY